MSARRVILDTAPGIDDSLAILLALASPKLQSDAVAVTSGNCLTAQGVVNAFARWSWPVPITCRSPGVDMPPIQPLLTAPETHGSTGRGSVRLPLPRRQPADQHAVNLVIESIMAAPGVIRLVPVGPLTNLATAIRREPGIVKAMRRE